MSLGGGLLEAADRRDHADRRSGAQPAGAFAGGGLRRVLVALCLTQVTSWGVLYYAFPVLSGRISADTGWPAPTLAAAFSAGLVVSAVLGMVVGRWLDRHGPRWLMTIGSLVAVAAVVAIAWSPTVAGSSPAGCWPGSAMSAVLYPPAFAALTRWYGPRAVGALTILTLAGGLASTIFAPLTAASGRPAGLARHLPRPRRHPAGGHHARPPARAEPALATGTADQHARQAPDRVVRSRSFLALVAALALASCASYAVVVNLVPLLAERHIALGLAAVALGLGGAGQVLGRLGYGWLAGGRRPGTDRRSPWPGVAVTTALLAAFTSLAALIVLAVLAGMVRGIATLVQATAVTDRWGAAHYGQLSGVLAAPVTVAAAVAPWVGAALADTLGGYASMFWAMAGDRGAAAVLGLASVPARPVRP